MAKARPLFTSGKGAAAFSNPTSKNGFCPAAAPRLARMHPPESMRAPATGLAFQDYPPSGLPDWPQWIRPPRMQSPVPATDSYPRLGTALPRKIAGIIRKVAFAREGERNALTYWASCRMAEMVAAGEMAGSLGLEIIAEAAFRAGGGHG
jgi:hypothetical protein